MRNIIHFILCAALLLSMTALSGCSGRKNDTGAGYLFTCTLDDSPECLDPQYTQNPYAAIVLANTMEGLMRTDGNGSIVCAQAERYVVSEDGLRYRFTLRSDCYWYGPHTDPERPERVTSKDYLFAFRRLIDPAQYSPYGDLFSCIKNAKAIRDGSMKIEHLGVSAPDATTLEIELERAEPEFLALLTLNCAVPCNQAFFESTQGRYGLDIDTVLCNGPFYITRWIYDKYGSGNYLICRKAAQFHDAEAVMPSTLQFNIMHSRAQAEQDFAEKNSDILITDLYPADYLKSRDHTVLSRRSRTMGLIFNPEHEQLASDSLRQALASAIDRSVLDPLLSEDMTPAYGVIPPAVTLLGRSYRELYADEQLSLPYDPERSRALFTQAAEEVGQISSLRIMIPSTIRDTDAMLAVCQSWQDLFGCYIGIETVSPEEYSRRLASGDYSIALWSFQPERNSCLAALDTLQKSHERLGFAEKALDPFITAVPGTEQLSDTIDIYSEAERTVLEAHAFIPLFYKNTYLITTKGNEDIGFDPFTGTVSLRDAKHFH